RQVLADKDDFGAARLIFTPGGADIAAHGLVHTLENDFSVSAVHPQDAFIAQHARAVNLDQAAQEFIQLRDVERAVAAEYKSGYARSMAAVCMAVFLCMIMVAMFVAVMIVVVMVMRRFFQEGGIDF